MIQETVVEQDNEIQTSGIALTFEREALGKIDVMTERRIDCGQ